MERLIQTFSCYTSQSEIEPAPDHVKDVDLGRGWSKMLKPHPFIIVDMLKRGS